MEKLVELVKQLGVMRVGASIAVGCIALVFFLFLAMRYSGPQLSLLYGNLDATASQQIQLELSKREVDYDVRDDNKSIYVPTSDLGRLRIELAEIGLAGDVIGYEVFDDEATLGTSNFTQKINRLRALEGELVRTIISMKGVKGARVHLVLPERKLFSREKERPTASVVLKMATSRRLTEEQIASIQYIVAAAVPKLKVSDISIADNSGALLARGRGDNETEFAMRSLDEKRVNFEGKLREQIQGLLTRTLGIGKARVEVSVDMDQSKVVINDETFDPEGVVIRSRETIEENSDANSTQQDVVTVGNNIPNSAPDAAGGSGTSEKQVRTEQRDNFEISRRVQNTVIEPGRVRGISVAVLVDGEYITNEEGVDVYSPRSEEELEKITELVKSAIGFNEDLRNDKVKVVNLKFTRLPSEVEEVVKLYLGFFTDDDIKRFLELFVLAGVGVLVVLLIIRPLVMRAFDSPELSTVSSIGKGMVRMPDGRMVYIDPETGEQQEVAVAAGQSSSMGIEEEDDVGKALDSLIGGSGGPGGGKNASLRKITEIIEKYPDDAVNVIRNWMSEDM